MTEEQSAPDPLRDLDPRFTFDFVAYDDLADGQRWSTWLSVEPLCRGPEPRPSWVVTSQGAIDTELGILKTGKEAEAFLVDRTDPHDPAQSVVMVAKRYRGEENRDFNRSASYTDGRKIRNSRDARAMAKRTAHGRAVAAGQWAWAEWQALVRCHQLGLPVPYPVQLDGTELLMEWIKADDESAPRLSQTRPTPQLLAGWFDQLREAMLTLAEAGLVHGDLSPYNILAAGEQIVIIDLPQMADLVGNPQGFDFLLRDCTNVCAWFRSKGLEVDHEALFGELVAHAL